MIALTAADVAAATGGHLHGARPGAVVHGPVVADPDAAQLGSLFVALPGPDVAERTARALRSGAALVLLHERDLRPVGGTLPTAAPVPALLVADVETALADLARAVLLRLRTDDETGATRLSVVGVTGSVGRATARALLAHVLTPSGPTVAAPAAAPSSLDVPADPAGTPDAPGTAPDPAVELALTVLHADESTRFLVLDLGAEPAAADDDPTAVAPPDVAVVLGLASARAGDLAPAEAAARHAARVVAGLAPGGLVVLDADDTVVASLAQAATGDVTTFGRTAGADVRATDVVVDRAGRPSFTVTAAGRAVDVALGIVGADHVPEALAVVAAALRLGVDAGDVAERLRAAGTLSPHRMHVVERPDGVTVVDDSADADPESMRAALKTLAVMAGRDRRSVAVLGEMRDVGPHHRDAHEAIGLMVVRLNVGLTVVVGAGAQPIADGALREGSWGDEVAMVDDVDAAAAFLARELAAGDVVLVKAAPHAGLTRLGDVLTGDPLTGDVPAGDGAAAPGATPAARTGTRR